MTTIALLSGGGSTAKSSTAVTLATLLAQEGKIVRLIDLDYQQNSSAWLRGTHHHPTSGEVLRGNMFTLAEATTHTDVDGLFLVPASDTLHVDEVEMTRDPGSEEALYKKLASAPPADVNIIDCQGDIGMLTMAGLLAADAVIAVVDPTTKSAKGLPRIQSLIQDAHQVYGHTWLELAAIVPCKVRRGNAGAIYSDSLEMIREVFGELVTPPVRDTARVPEAEAQRTPLPIHAPSHGSTEDYRAVRTWLADRGVV